MKQSSRGGRVREHIAQEAAKIMHEQSLRDYQQAKRKACERLGLSDKAAMPGNVEIQQALAAYLELFKADTQPELITRLRKAAVIAMRFLAEFEPRLVGGVLQGTADRHMPVQLHVFAEPPELILQFLIEQGVDYQLAGKRVQYCDGRVDNITLCQYRDAGVMVELFLFDRKGLREAPRSPVDGRPMQRMNLREVEKLIDD